MSPVQVMLGERLGMATIAQLIGDAAGSLDEPFRAADILAWFQTHAPAVKQSSVRAHIQALTGNATNRIENAPVVGARPAVLYRLGHGLYRRWRPTDVTAPPDGMEAARLDLASPISPLVAAPAAMHEPASAREVWSREGNVQAALISWLATHGWRIRRVADTQSREPGTDVVAERDAEVLHVEVKGWPSAKYVDPRRAEEQKRSTASGQARVWFADAVLHALRLRDANDGDLVAIALPQLPTYINLATSIAGSLRTARVAVLFVMDTGEVAATGETGNVLA